MKKFLMLLHEDVSAIQQLSTREMEELVNAHMKYAEQLADSGHLISGDGLEENGKVFTEKGAIIKDGPYMESKEIIGGYYLIEARDMDEAVSLAADCPCHLWGGKTEIRQIMNYEE